LESPLPELLDESDDESDFDAAVSVDDSDFDAPSSLPPPPRLRP
jgi:hypothetical protein